jgi:hypothetical protein
VALLSAICLLSNLNNFERAGFLFQSDGEFNYARLKNSRKKIIPAYADEKITLLREKEIDEKKQSLSRAFRFAFDHPKLFQHSNMPLLKKSLHSLIFLPYFSSEKKKIDIILTGKCFYSFKFWQKYFFY